MVCSRVSGKFSTDSLGSSLCCCRRFSLLSLILNSKSDTPWSGSLSLYATLPIPQKKKKLIQLSFQVLLHQMKSLKRNPDNNNKKPPAVHVYFITPSFHCKDFSVLLCYDYKNTCPLCWDTTWSDKLLIQACVKYTLSWPIGLSLVLWTGPKHWIPWGRSLLLISIMKTFPINRILLKRCKITLKTE